jgi:hypothetical protein
MTIEGFEVDKKGDIYYPKIQNAPHDICIKIRKRISNLDGSDAYCSYCNYYFWGKGHPSPYHPTDPYYSTTEEGAVKKLLTILKKLMDEHDNNPDKFCWEPAYYLANDEPKICEKTGYCPSFQIDPEVNERGWGWTRDSYSHLIMGNGKIVSGEQFSK